MLSKISMQGCFPSAKVSYKFLGIDETRTSFLGTESTPIVFRINGKMKAISKGTLNQWLNDNPDNLELLKAEEAYDGRF